MKAASLKDKTVLVTGAASGIGRRLSQDLFWNEKSRLILVDVDAEELEILRNELEPPGEGDHVESVVCDIGSGSSVEKLVKAVGDRRVDVLINNAGIAQLGSFAHTDFADFERVVQVNLLGTARLTKAFLPACSWKRSAPSPRRSPPPSSARSVIPYVAVALMLCRMPFPSGTVNGPQHK